MSRRKEFEDRIRMQREHMGNYLKYAAWEESQREFERSRSIYERGLDIDYQQPTIWLKCVLDSFWVWCGFRVGLVDCFLWRGGHIARSHQLSCHISACRDCARGMRSRGVRAERTAHARSARA